MKKWRVGLLLGLCLLTLTGCFEKELQLGQERVIESSKRSAPKWVKEPPKADRKWIYFVGEDTSYSNSTRYATQMAISKVASYISVQANNLYKRTETSVDQNEAQVLRESYINQVSNSMVRGALEKEVYWEKYERLTDKGIQYYYRVYSIVTVPKDLLDRESNQILDKQIAVANATGNTALAATLSDIKKSLNLD